MQDLHPLQLNTSIHDVSLSKKCPSLQRVSAQQRFLHLECCLSPRYIAPWAFSCLQELQDDLQEILQLHRRAAEYQLACYPSSGSQYVRHRDALPDDGADLMQRKVRLPSHSALWLIPGLCSIQHSLTPSAASCIFATFANFASPRESTWPGQNRQKSHFLAAELHLTIL